MKRSINDETSDSTLVRAEAVCEFLTISRATLWRWAATGALPKPIKLGENVTAWRVGDLRQWINQRAIA